MNISESVNRFYLVGGLLFSCFVHSSWTSRVFTI